MRLRGVVTAALVLVAGAPAVARAEADCTVRGIVVEREVPIENRFGERIAVDVHRPLADEGCRFPVVLESSAYRDWMAPQEIDALTEDARRGWWVERGYVFAFADVPGTGASEGTWCMFCEREQLSGVDMVNALGEAPWSNGKVGMIGGSYPGITAMLVAQHEPEHLSAVIAAAFTDDLYSDFLYVDGLPRGEDWQTVATVFTYIDALSATRDMDFFALQSEHPTEDGWYAERRLRPEDIEVPVFALGGWNDIFDRSVWRTFDRLGSSFKALLQGPFTHVPVMVQNDAWPCVDHASDFCGAPLFDHFLKGEDTEEWRALEAAPVRIYVEPHHGYVSGHAKPATTPWSMALGDRGATGVVRADPTAGASGGRWFARGSVPGTYPPFDHVLGVDGPLDQRVEEAKLLSIATEPLPEDLTVLGGGTLALRVRTDAVADLSVRIVDEWPVGSAQHPEGFAYRVGSGWRRIGPVDGGWQRVEVDLWPIGYRFAAGHRLRIDIAGADAPRFVPLAHDFEVTVDLAASRLQLREISVHPGS
jgi:predicted acyl esterase